MTQSINWGDLKKAADDATKPAPIGDYVCEITKCEATTASTSGNPMLKATMRITDGPAAGKTIFNNFNVTLDSAFAMSIFFRHMAAFGLNDQFFAGGPAMEQVAAALVGRRANVTLGIRQWQGADRNQVDNVTALGGLQMPVASSVAGPSVPSPGVPTSTPSPTPVMTTPTTPATPSSPATAPTTAPPIPTF